MPLIQNNKRINPLDINKNATIGTAIPLNEVNMTSGTTTISEQLKTNLLNLLLTIPGERINNPNYGIGLKQQLFENNLDKTTLLEVINSQVSFFIPEIVINNLELEQNLDEYKVTMKLSYISKLDNEEDSVQINYR
tara:strand:- start:1354 stop:1761 length:408 start_codon:yes stop_codon:yes gene_type:complete